MVSPDTDGEAKMADRALQGVLAPIAALFEPMVSWIWTPTRATSSGMPRARSMALS